MTNKLQQFSLELDIVLGLQPGETSKDSLLQTASVLSGLEFEEDAAPQKDLRTRWVSRSRSLTSRPPTRSLFAAKWAWAAALTILLVLLVTFRQPVFAAVGRLFGYIYFQGSGFLPADSTLVLTQPVVQEHEGRALLVTQGVATPNETSLYLEYSDIASPGDGAQLETPDGPMIPLSWWEYTPNTTDTRGVHLIFPALPVGVTQTTLILPDGWHLPLEWTPATGSGLPDVQVVPYLATNPEASSQTDGCMEKNGMSLCVLAARTSAESTSVLVESRPSLSGLHASWMGTVWQTEAEPATLQNTNGESYPLIEQQTNTLLFPPIPGGQPVTLTVPALLADVDIPDQTIMVDMRPDPQPDTVIPLDVSIHVLSTTVHFSQATFVGDGINSLRLTLDADPVQTVDGITPLSVEIGKPDRIDDLYSGGMLAGSKDIFMELIRAGGKITGVLSIPVVKATVSVAGPFDFTFSLPETQALTPTPVVVDPNTFAPIPSPMPLSLDSYVYSGQPIQRGDLLFTAINADNTDIFVFTPNADDQLGLLATLPGAVSQIYIHPDRQGLDYLAGSAEFRDGFSYIDHIQLYTLSFADQKPRFLYNFAPNPANTIGTTVFADWSFDGKYLAFRDSGGDLPGHEERFGWFDMACRSSGKCILHEIPVAEDLSLSAPIFAPSDYRILFSGADESGTGEPDIFLLDFDPGNSDTPILNLITQLFISDGVNAPAWTLDGKILDICFDGMSWETNDFCTIEPGTGDVSYSPLIAPNLGDYRLYGGIFWLQPNGNQVAIAIFPKNGTRRSLQELRLMDLTGRLGVKLAESQWIEYVAFPPPGNGWRMPQMKAHTYILQM